MISHNRSPRCEDERWEALIRQALRQRIAGAQPPQQGWTHLAARVEVLGRSRRQGWWAELSVLGQVAMWCLGVADRMLPLLEVPPFRSNDPDSARNHVHWTWLNRHHVAVRLLC